MSDLDAWGKVSAAVGGLVAVVAGAYATVMRARKSRPPDEEPPKLPASVRPVMREELDALARRVALIESGAVHATECDEERARLREEHDELERRVGELDREGLKSLGEINRELARVMGFIEGQQEERRSRRG